MRDGSLLPAVRVGRWLSKDHPDPNRFHLAIVAAVARLYMKAGTDTSPPSRGQYFSPLTSAFTAKGLGAPDFAFFCTRIRESTTAPPRQPH